MIEEESIRDDDHHDADCNCYRCEPPLPDDETEREHMERMIAFSEYQQHKEKVALEKEQEECPHDEHDHGICLDCGKDIMDDLIGRADLLEDR